MSLGDGPEAQIKFLYLMGNDVEAMRRFYTDIVGLKQGPYKKDAYVGYTTGELQILIFKYYEPVPANDGFAMQPGWKGGALEVTSWSVSIPHKDLVATIDRLRGAGVRSFFDEPQWQQDSYWGFPVLDPMGNTVEIYATPDEKPESKQWPGSKIP